MTPRATAQRPRHFDGMSTRPVRLRCPPSQLAAQLSAAIAGEVPFDQIPRRLSGYDVDLLPDGDGFLLIEFAPTRLGGRREQICQATGRQPIHVAELLRLAIDRRDGNR